MPDMPRVVERFWQKVNPGDGGPGCWTWQAGKDRQGYGIFAGPNSARAHRASWELFRGPIPSGAIICHHCDNPGCVNPAHLFLGTPKQNTADMLRKGREAKGARHGLAKLTDQKVRDIRRLHGAGVSQYDLADLFRVSQPAIGAIVRRKTWRHVQ